VLRVLVWPRLVFVRTWVVRGGAVSRDGQRSRQGVLVSGHGAFDGIG
jgi:hypothetical protein